MRTSPYRGSPRDGNNISPTRLNSSFPNTPVTATTGGSASTPELPPLVINPKTIFVAVVKFIFICLNVAFAIYASKVVFCSTFFVSQPTQWLTGIPADALTMQQRELARIASFGSRFAYCVKNF